MIDINDPFKKTREMLSSLSDKIKNKVDKVLEHRKTEKDLSDEYVAELKADVVEVESFSKDSRYPRTQKFILNLRTGYSKELERLAANGNIDTVEIARLGARIETLDKLKNRANDLIKELMRVNKEINAKQNS
jgi:hypothetical protein